MGNVRFVGREWIMRGGSKAGDGVAYTEGLEFNLLQ
jgi:hypothetical protein